MKGLTLEDREDRELLGDAGTEQRELGPEVKGAELCTQSKRRLCTTGHENCLFPLAKVLQAGASSRFSCCLQHLHPTGAGSPFTYFQPDSH